MPKATFDPEALKEAPKRTRIETTGLRQAKAAERFRSEGGSDIIAGVSLITRGEALGHELWIDDEMLSQVAAALRSSSGIKARFTHPGLSSDGLGSYIGRMKAGDYEVDDRVFGDLFLPEYIEDSPDFAGGDIREYLKERARQDPDSFGVSIVFKRDRQAESQFMLENGAVVKDSGYIDTRGFKSPDPNNKNNFTHARLKVLLAADVVDSPAANPDGLFHSRGSQFAAAAESALAYALGLSDDAPEAELSSFGVEVDSERLRAFVGRFFNSRGIEVQMSKADEKTGRDYIDAFGTEMGALMFANDVPWEEASQKFNAAREEKINSLSAQLAELKPQLAEVESLKAEKAKLAEELETAKASLAKAEETNKELSGKLEIATGQLGEKQPPGSGLPAGGATKSSGKVDFSKIVRIPGRN